MAMPVTAAVIRRGWRVHEPIGGKDCGDYPRASTLMSVPFPGKKTKHLLASTLDQGEEKDNYIKGTEVQILNFLSVKSLGALHEGCGFQKF